jgi:hypothetical protein
VIDRLQRVLFHPVSEYVLGPGLLLLAGLASGWESKVAVAVPGFLLVAGSRYFGERARERSDARAMIFQLLAVTVNTLEAARPTPADRSLRANLMLVDRDHDALRMAYHTTGYDPGELKLLWHLGQGCAGEAWQRRATVIAPEGSELPVSVEDADKTDRPWNMTSEQVRMTALTISSVLSVPVFLPVGPLVGVLTLDDSKKLDESKLGTSEVRQAAEAVASDIGALLTKAGTDIPESIE